MAMEKRNSILMIAAVILSILIIAAGVLYYRSIPTESSLYLTLTVNYTDGTTRVFDSRSQNLRQTIVDASTGLTVSSINTNLVIIPVFTGTIQSYTVTGSLSVHILNVQANSKVFDSGILPLNPTSHPTLVSGSSSIISSSTVTASALQSLYTGWSTSNTYALVDSFANVKVTLTFTDSTQLSQTVASGQISWNFVYHSDNTFTSLSVVFSLSTT